MLFDLRRSRLESLSRQRALRPRVLMQNCSRGPWHRLKRATRHRFASRWPRNRRRRRQVTVELLQSAYWRVATLLGRWAKFNVHTRNIG